MPFLAPPAWATHKGWLGLCPVYLADIDSEGPTVEPRWRALAWLMPVSEAVFFVLFALAAAARPGEEPSWPILVTGELPRPEGAR